MVTPERTGAPVRVGLRWRDLDHQGHVYHGTLLTLLDEARTAWLRDVVGVRSADSYVVARIEVDYLAEILVEHAAIDVSFEVARIGRRSITTGETVRTPGGLHVAQASVVLVMWDRQGRSSRELTPGERERARERLAAPEEVAADA
ncbi:thioesterase family protein [Spongiactinospora sp. TRM90649]|uniref:acyl-CoA thioesterase n=1 Tax=Spongiactinospora sp. TRM90649 TaxID=3031114 RepID=UPI0023F99F93|nr:thioesterase family protein [Spongiactinospora sp. TRM90649]MDF5758306.1 hotdog domain-containing protein [Spongiactinospora sp. TRM90649]